MTSFLTRVAAAVACTVLAHSSVIAQGRGVELGIDAGVFVQSADGSSVTTINIPAQSFRAGFFLSDKLSLEPSVGISYTSVEDFSFTTYGLGVGLLYHLTTDRDRPQVFLRPLIGYSGVSAEGESNGSAAVGFGAGAKIPQGDRLAIRFGAEYQRRLEDGSTPAINGFGATLGISFFTR